MDTSFDKARFNMIQQQIRPWDVVDQRVLNAMADLPREQFVPEAYHSLAYADIEIPLGEGQGQSMLAPKVVGRMLQAVNIQDDDRILEIGTGSGYGTACLALLGGPVVSLEIDADLAGKAQAVLTSLGLRGVEVRVADGMAGPVEGGPFDAIVLTGSTPDEEPLTILREQLAPGGRLFAIVGEEPAMAAVLVTRVGATDYRRDSLFETSVPALANVPEPEHFTF